MNPRLFLFPVLFLLTFNFSQAQDTSAVNPEAPGGRLMLGMRSTMSTFSDESSNGIGVGGQFRLRVSKQLNTEWFADYIKSDIEGLANREDAHIGWSVMFYMLDMADQDRRLHPYVLGGHCFDHTKVENNLTSLSRWSSAVHMGLGSHLRLTKRTDLSLSGQYMIHLGDDIVAEDKFMDAYGNENLRIKREDLGLEGHLFLTLSVNILVADLW